MDYKKALLLGFIFLSVGILIEYSARIIHNLNKPPIGPTMVGTLSGISLSAVGLGVLIYSIFLYMNNNHTNQQNYAHLKIDTRKEK